MRQLIWFVWFMMWVNIVLSIKTFVDGYWLCGIGFACNALTLLQLLKIIVSMRQ